MKIRHKHCQPAGKYKVGELTINYGNFPLRLYCLRISDSLVVLFNGAEKTSATAQNGKTSLVFSDAYQFAKRILKALIDRDITTNKREFKNFNNNDEILL